MITLIALFSEVCVTLLLGFIQFLLMIVDALFILSLIIGELIIFFCVNIRKWDFTHD